MHNPLPIPRIAASSTEEAFGKFYDLPAEEIGQVNWPGQFPYAPKTFFKAFHNGEKLFLHFHVQEDVTMAQVGEDNGEVWTDSAVEFFITFDETGYYNFEFTCIGKALLGFRKLKPEAVHADSTVMQSIERSASLGTELFAEKHIDGGWTLNVAIPVSAFFKHQIRSLDGRQARGNFYKCGDNLSKPHFVSWAPIGTVNPNFHVPEFFGTLVFEK